MNAVHAEWTKLRTLPGTLWLVLGAIVVTIGISAFAAATASCQPGACSIDPIKTSLTGVVLGQTLIAVLAVLTISGEYDTGMIQASLSAVPRRGTVLAAKVVVVTLAALVAAVPAVLASLIVGWLILPGQATASTSLVSGAAARAGLGAVLYLVLIALLSLGIATGARDSAAAIGTVLALLYLFPLVSLAVSDPHLRRLLNQIAPMSAGLVIQATATATGAPAIGPWQGQGVVAAWAGGALLIAALALRWRDA